MPRGTAPPLDPDALRDARRDARLSQNGLARAVGTTRQQIIRYENGAERPEIGRLAALARACGVTVEDLVLDGSLPPGLAGLRVGAGLTMAAAATALRERTGPDTGIATNRANLSYAERGRMPLSWRPASAGARVCEAMAGAYEADLEQVRAAWTTTFNIPAPVGLPEHPTGAESPAADEAAPQPAPPARRTPAWRPLSAWLWERLVQVAAAGPAGADDDWTGGARWQEHLATRERPRGTTGRGYVDDDTAGRYWLTEAGRDHILDHRDAYADLYPQVRHPRAVREMTADTLLRVEDPEAYTARQVWGTTRPASQRWTIRARVRTLAGGIIPAVVHGIEGYVPSVLRWHRDDDTGSVRPPRVDEVVEVTEWTSPWRSMPEAAPDLPGVRPAPQAGAVELPFDGDDSSQQRETEVRLELVRQEEADQFELDAIRMWRVWRGPRLVGFVWRTDDVRQTWAGARADAHGQLGAIASLSPTLHRTRRSVVEHLLDPDASYFTAPCAGQGEAVDPASVVEAPGGGSLTREKNVRTPDVFKNVN